MKTNSEIKNEALAALRGKWGYFLLLSVAYWTIIALIETSGIWCSAMQQNNFEGQFLRYGPKLWISIAIIPVLRWGYEIICLRNQRGEQTRAGNLFDGFKQYGRIWTTQILVLLYTSLWSLLFLIPGIIKSLSYALTPYILLDEPELSRNAAIERSMQMMDGHKKRLISAVFEFYRLDNTRLCVCSLIIYTLYSIYHLFIFTNELLTFYYYCLIVYYCAIGLCFLWLVPYIGASLAVFYEDVKVDWAHRAA